MTDVKKKLAGFVAVLALWTFTSVAAVAQPLGLTDAERAKVAAHGDSLTFLDAHCAPIERKVIDHQEVVRFKCDPALERAVQRVIVATGEVEREPRGFAAFTARLANGAAYAIGAVITIVLIYAKAQG